MRLALGALLSAVALLGLVGCGSIPVPASGQPMNSPPLTPAAAPLPGATDAKPLAVDVPSIGAKSSLIPLGINPKNGEATVPDVDHPQQAGWLQVKTHDPDKIAPLVILGHVDGGKAKPGVFFHLKTIKVGAKVSVDMSDGTTRTYTITKFRQISKTGFPTAAVYAGTSNSEIRLITCGGPLDTKAHNYLDSEIAFGVQDPAK
jgi:LPXTG-site transpeptidase (sortase) family protein